MNKKNVDSDVFPEATYDELKTALENWLNPEEEEAETPTATTETAAPTGVTTTGDVDKAFDDLFNS